MSICVPKMMGFWESLVLRTEFKDVNDETLITTRCWTHLDQRKTGGGLMRPMAPRCWGGEGQVSCGHWRTGRRNRRRWPRRLPPRGSMRDRSPPVIHSCIILPFCANDVTWWKIRDGWLDISSRFRVQIHICSLKAEILWEDCSFCQSKFKKLALFS